MKNNGQKIDAKEMIQRFGCKKSFYYYIKRRDERMEENNLNYFLKMFKIDNGVFKCSPAKQEYEKNQYPDIFIGMTQ